MEDEIGREHLYFSLKKSNGRDLFLFKEINLAETKNILSKEAANLFFLKNTGTFLNMRSRSILKVVRAVAAPNIRINITVVKAARMYSEQHKSSKNSRNSMSGVGAA